LGCLLISMTGDTAPYLLQKACKAWEREVEEEREIEGESENGKEREKGKERGERNRKR
jgi:hypothetical protein